MSETTGSTTPSDEVDERQLELARKQGDAYREALEYMVSEVADVGETKEEGDYLIGIAVEEAEGLYETTVDGDLAWREPDEENCHVEVAVCDADDGRFLPGVDVDVTVHDEDGGDVASFSPEFLWHPGLFHYGANVRVPGDGQYTIRVHVDPPRFRRHDERNGDRYRDTVEVNFGNVRIETGQD